MSPVLIVGYGPVGQVLALLLARQGHPVTVVERWAAPYPMPRATVLDGETARTLAVLGLGDALGVIGSPVDAYDWRNARGESLLRMNFAAPGAYGWPDATAFHQPALEQALAARAAEPGIRELITVHRGHTAVRLAETPGAVTLTARTADGAERTLHGSWLIGCDGANSFVREAIGASVTDLGFSHDWLLCDVVPKRDAAVSAANTQICNPRRPTTTVGSGPGRRRFEFMRLPGEPVADLDREDTAWRLLEPFDVTPENATLARHTVYTFRAAVADTFQRGRVLLAGDAAHTMPPFAGAGLCSGIRDVLNLSWKLDRVLRGVSDQRLLETYQPERRAHALDTIEFSVRLGRIVCVTDEAEAAARDAALAAETMPDRPVSRPLRAGLLHLTVGTVAAAPTGSLMPQGRVRADGVTGLFDEVVGVGFTLLTTEDPDTALGDGVRAALARIGVRTVRVVAAGAAATSAEIADLDGVYLPFFAASRARFLLVRPDFHIFGAGRNARELGLIVEQLRSALEVRHSPGD
ncbi:bifunctional 3-(3-hydroxy-phenyl)propionate/3-hydroxycinnamic acid hydroxylase [Actinoplanes teichomyceticus]|uniref:Flavoprotein hydroxylase n=1 Tax=Actinoplanes teichomyceticus TaxID=1867 RepID=A0A561WBI0_ACTTI|nr:bifunctional 3-(3-hydroxy-phenyl)propionate/3-hydroxycinnamic acid hydroxylase [Actinoplanes teichomyceticus]TWG21220.1 flavoprotein hydroxylase [Actinoplanes teichomyceticus]GIF17078.1 3-(3-hydroxyphenyl)propionate hydroxylase [Actinoplanes teichomyceticus]